MTNKLKELLKGNLANGLIALIIISGIALGCTCNQDDGFQWGSKDDTDQTDDRKQDDDRVEEEDVGADFEADENEVPSVVQSRALVEDTLMNFNEAVQKGDFADFRETVARRWRDNSKVSDFNKGFKEFIDKEIDISRVRNNVPVFSPDPRIGRKYGRRVLFLKGEYETRPLPVNFNLEYIVESNRWKLVFIGVDTRRK